MTHCIFLPESFCTINVALKPEAIMVRKYLQEEIMATIEEIKEERAFIHDIASPLMIAMEW